MWSLQSINGDTGHKLICNKDIIVGRKDADIVIAGDSSVSRKHAVINVTHHSGDLRNPGKIPSIAITDHSKFGTFFTRAGATPTKITDPAQLAHGDTVQFGAQRSVFKLTYKPLVIATSMLDDAMKTRLQEVLLKLGGHMVNSWHDQVTHVIVNEIKLSIKVTQALAHCSHIVSPDYIFQLEESVNQKALTPHPEEYLPKLAEPNLSNEDCCFKVNQGRKNVFAERTFVYLCKKQHKRLGATVAYGGGKNLLIDDAMVNDKLLSDVKTSILFCSPVQEDQLISNSRYEHIQTVVLSEGRRFIQEHEVGLAVLYCDASVYCNSAFELNSQNILTQSALAKTATLQPVKNDELPTQRREPTGEAAPFDTVTRNSTKKRVREDDVPGTSHDRHIENCFTDLTENVAEGTTSAVVDGVAAKKARLSEVSCPEQRTSVAPDTFECDIAAETKEEVSVVEDIPDSYLVDDNLWSQNFDSSSFLARQKVRPQPATESAAPMHKTPAKAVPKVKTEIKSPCPVAAFPKSCSSAAPGSAQQRLKQENATPSKPRESGANAQPNTVISGTGSESNTHMENGSYHPSYPLQVTKVTVVPLVVRRNNVVDASSQNVEVKNFKRFKKVWPTYMTVHGEDSDSVSSHRTPRIIGGKDFYVYKEKKGDGDIGDWFDNNGVAESQGSNPFAVGF